MGSVDLCEMKIIPRFVTKHGPIVLGCKNLRRAYAITHAI